MRLFPSSYQEQILNSTVVMEFSDQRTAGRLIPTLSQAKGFSTNSACWSIPSVEKPTGGALRGWIHDWPFAGFLPDLFFRNEGFCPSWGSIMHLPKGQILRDLQASRGICASRGHLQDACAAAGSGSRFGSRALPILTALVYLFHCCVLYQSAPLKDRFSPLGNLWWNKQCKWIGRKLLESKGICYRYVMLMTVNHIFLTTSAREAYKLHFLIGLPRAAMTDSKMAWKHFSGDKQWKWSNIKNNPKGKKIRNNLETKEGWSKQPFWRVILCVALLIGPRNASESCIRNLYTACLYLLHTVF